MRLSIAILCVRGVSSQPPTSRAISRIISSSSTYRRVALVRKVAGSYTSKLQSVTTVVREEAILSPQREPLAIITRPAPTCPTRHIRPHGGQQPHFPVQAHGR